MSDSHRPPRLRAALLALCVCLAGCAGVERTVRSAGSDPRDTIWRVVDELAQRVKGRGDSALDMLALSGGGQNGAYAAGFLRGWRDRPSNALPDFDLVTAVGSGTLQAPFALIGTKEALARSAELFHDSAVTLASTPETWFELRASGRSTGTGAYERLVIRTVDENLQNQLRPVFAERRQLAIATTDLDLGVRRIWDFGHELGTTDKSLERAQTLLVAAVTVPGAMDPVIIDDHVHATGALQGNLLIPFELEHYRALANRLRDSGVTRTLEIRLWVLLNSFTEPAIIRAHPESREELGQRAGTLAYIASQSALVERLTNLAYAINGGVNGLKMQLKITAIPVELVEQAGISDDYDSRWMTQLEQAGYDRAMGNSPWDRVVTASSNGSK